MATNPYLTFSNAPVSSFFFTPPPRESWLQVVYSSQKFFTYALNEWEKVALGTFDPNAHGERFYMFVPLGTCYDIIDPSIPTIAKPDFISAMAWNKEEVGDSRRGLYWQASGFVNAVDSVMPKLFIPSIMLIENGSDDVEAHGVARIRVTDAAGNLTDPFTWAMTGYTGSFGTIQATQQTPYYLAWTGKNDSNDDNTVTFTLSEPINPPTGSWYPSDLVGQGAFCIALCVTPQNPAGVMPEALGQKTWNIAIDIGNIHLFLQEGGALTALLDDGNPNTEKNSGSINLPDAAAAEGAPQNSQLTGKKVYNIVVYPVWNGIVVTSGIQDVRPSVNSSSMFVPKLKKAAILDSDYSTAFDPVNPPSSPNWIEVGVGTGATDVMVSFGTAVTLAAKNCDFQVAYMPLYFSPRMWMDEWFLGSKDDPGVDTYTYDVWPIWTKNGTSYTLIPDDGTVIDSGIDGQSSAGTTYFYVPWRFEQDLVTPVPSRHSPQLFGTIMRTQDQSQTHIRNDDGAFTITVDVVGTPGDPSPTANWYDYITNVNTTIGVDGSSGSMTVDKYGFAGQEAAFSQSCGLVRLSGTGGYGTTAGEFFIGYGMGIGETRSTEGATWQVPLVGQEQKLNDIALVNAPFVDGWVALKAFQFLLIYYAGINLEDNYGLSLVNLRVSENIQSPVFNWEAGRTLKSALDEICEDIQAVYVVERGLLRVFKVDSTTGLPINPSATDWEPYYPDVKIVSTDLTPQLDDLRNEIIVAGMENVTQGSGTNIANLPLFPRLYVLKQDTIPSIPWARRIVHVTQGVLTMSGSGGLEDLADKIAAASRRYTTTGRTSIPGNANIKLYDNWGDSIIVSYTHNVDVQAKTWTTDLEFASGYIT